VAVGRVVVVSDTHLSPLVPEADANWDAVVGHVETLAADAVVHVGDVSLDGANNPHDLRHARLQLDRLALPWRAIPGNHDVGDNPWPGSGHDFTVNADRQRRWLETFGDDHWVLDVERWSLLAVNAQLFGSGLAAESTQWAWLEERVAERPRHQSLALFTHKPIVASDVELTAAPPYRFVPSEARQRLNALFADRQLRLVVSGHVHQYRTLDHDRTQHVWAPTTWAVLPDEIQPTVGVKRSGIVSIELDGDGGVEARFIAPAGLRQLTLLRDIADPYQH
jgi:3',5'-cyclic-AMP phosphodiesterase